MLRVLFGLHVRVDREEIVDPIDLHPVTRKEEQSNVVLRELRAKLL